MLNENEYFMPLSVPEKSLGRFLGKCRYCRNHDAIGIGKGFYSYEGFRKYVMATVINKKIRDKRAVFYRSLEEALDAFMIWDNQIVTLYICFKSAIPHASQIMGIAPEDIKRVKLFWRGCLIKLQQTEETEGE